MSSSTPRTPTLREPGSRYDSRAATATFVGTSRFTLRRSLGEGSMGAVYLVFDRQLGAEVALKTLRHVDASGIYRFKREFRALADVRHPNLVKLHELFCEDGEWFFTMEYVEGSDFLEHVLGAAAHGSGERTPVPTQELSLDDSGERLEHADHGEQVHGLELLFPSPQRDLERLREVMRQVAVGLCAVHAAGKLHRDLKSDNVIVTAAGRAVLLDFGIAAERTGQLHKTLDVGVMGTPAYMSPEQADGRPVDEATDWYSFGVMLYEALTGSVPFDGTYLQVIQQKQQLDPLPPSQVVSGVPPDLDELCMQLLSRDSASRPRGESVLRALVDKRAASVPPPRPSLQAEALLPFVGRKAQLDALDQALAQTNQGRPGLVFVHGDSGMGKTMLVDAFLARLRERGDAVVLKGACYERESVPFKAFDSLIDTLSRYLRRLPPVRAAELLPRDVHALAQLFPVLKRVEVIRDARRRAGLPADPQELRRRAFAALRELFSRIADQQPLVLSIDDLQWGDVDSARLLCELIGGADSPALLCVATYRNGDITGSPCLQALFTHTRESSNAEFRQIAVAALAPEECYELARELLGQTAWIEARAIGAESQGSPFLLGELVRYAREHQQHHGIVPEDLSLDAALAQRLSGLSRGAEMLLQLTAVAGRPVPEHMLSLAAVFDIDLQDALSELRGARLVRGVAQRSLRAVDVYHDRIRRAVLASMPDHMHVLWHRRLATTLEASGSADLEALTRHLLGARDFARAGLYARRAALQAVEALAFDKAAELYAIAIEHVTYATIAERSELLAQWGDALVNAGRASRAAQVFFDAAALADETAARVLRRKAGVALLRSGELTRGLEALADTLARVGIDVPESFRDAFREARALRQQLKERGFVFARRAETELHAQTLEQLDTTFAITLGMLLTEVDRTLPLVVRLVLQALEVGEPGRVACALCLFHVYVDTGLSEALGERPLGALELAQTLATRVDDPRVRAWVAFARGHDSLRSGDVASATQRLQHAEELFRMRCTASEAEMRMCRQLMASLLAQSSQWSELDKCEEWAREAEEHGDHVGAVRLRMLATPLALAEDIPERAQRQCEESARISTRPEFDLMALVREMSTSQIDLYLGDGASCLRDVANLDAFFGSALAAVPLWRAQCHLLRALLLITASTTTDDADATLTRAEAELAAVAELAIACMQPQVQLLRATIETRRAHGERALELLDAVLQTSATRTDAAVVMAYARLRKGELLGGPEGAALVQQAETYIRAKGVRHPERLARLYAPS